MADKSYKVSVEDPRCSGETLSITLLLEIPDSLTVDVDPIAKSAAEGLLRSLVNAWGISVIDDTGTSDDGVQEDLAATVQQLRREIRLRDTVIDLIYSSLTAVGMGQIVAKSRSLATQIIERHGDK